MLNLLQNSNNYSKSSESLLQHYRDEKVLNNHDAIDDVADNTTTGSFKFKENITGQTGKDGTKSVKIFIPLKYLSNF